MTATYTCNGCNAGLDREDAGPIRRQLKDAEITVYVAGKPEDGGNLHLCPKCASDILLTGKRPVHDPDQIDF